MKNQLSKKERIEIRKKQIGSKHDRKLKRYSNGFNEIFNFFLNSYRKGILDFCGNIVDIRFDKNGVDAKEGFRLFEDGRFKNKIITCRHPNVLKSVIVGKKSWGLWKNEWCSGISECSFTRTECLIEFYLNNIKIPDSLKEDFENTLRKRRLEYFIKNHSEFLKSSTQFNASSLPSSSNLLIKTGISSL